MVTHDPAMARNADRLLTLCDGVIVIEPAPGDLTESSSAANRRAVKGRNYDLIWRAEDQAAAATPCCLTTVAEKCSMKISFF